jgi:hypothetical protein
LCIYLALNSYDKNPAFYKPVEGASKMSILHKQTHWEATSCDYLKGWIELDFSDTGDVTFRGHTHDSGLDNYDYSVAATIVARPLAPEPCRAIDVKLRIAEHRLATLDKALQEPEISPQRKARLKSMVLQAGAVISNIETQLQTCLAHNHLTQPAPVVFSFVHNGHVKGGLAGRTDDNWTENYHHSLVAKYFTDLEPAMPRIREWHEGALSQTLTKLIDMLLLRPLLGELIAPLTPLLTAVVFGYSIGTGGGVMGAATLIGDGLWLVGPEGTAFALGSTVLMSLGTKSRVLEDHEYHFVQRVFQGKLPPRDQILVCDTIGGQDRPFTWPRTDGKITLNLGPTNYANPCLTAPKTLIHELVHAWQLHNMGSEFGLLLEEMATQILHSLKGGQYSYDKDHYVSWESYNTEQQAQIIGDWFNVYYPFLESQEAKADPRFRYVDGIIRNGKPAQPGSSQKTLWAFIGTEKMKAAAQITGSASFTMTFWDQSLGLPAHWEWSFGDGKTSSIQNPSHCFETPGTYRVRLTVKRDNETDTEVMSNYIVVTGPYKMVPLVRERTVAFADKAIRNAGLTPKYVGPHSNKDHVLAQTPEAGTKVPAGTEVTMQCISGPLR